MTRYREDSDVMEALAAFDPVAFKIYTESTTSLKVIPMQQRDPLEKRALGEDVEVLAAMIDRDGKLDQYEVGLKQLGFDYGFMVV